MPDNPTFSFNGQDLRELVAPYGFDLYVTGIQGDGIMAASVDTTDRAGADGSWLVGAHLPERVVSVDYEMVAQSDLAFDTLEAAYGVDSLMTQVLHRPKGVAELRSSERDGYFLGVLSGVEVSPRLHHHNAGTLTFTCPSPFLYGEQVTTDASNGLVAVGTNYFVEPVIIWTLGGSSGAPHIDVDGERLTVDTQVSGGQQIRIDSTRKETRIAGVLEVEHIHGVYPRLYPYSRVSTSAGGDVSVTYQARWI